MHTNCPAPPRFWGSPIPTHRCVQPSETRQTRAQLMCCLVRGLTIKPSCIRCYRSPLLLLLLLQWACSGCNPGCINATMLAPGCGTVGTTPKSTERSPAAASIALSCLLCVGWQVVKLGHHVCWSCTNRAPRSQQQGSGPVTCATIRDNQGWSSGNQRQPFTLGPDLPCLG
jgi:hypothetical protein